MSATLHATFVAETDGYSELRFSQRLAEEVLADLVNMIEGLPGIEVIEVARYRVGIEYAEWVTTHEALASTLQEYWVYHVQSAVDIPVTFDVEPA